MYKHIFGPVLSRRLGMSLGVDLVPHKVCSMNCVYCECGATTQFTLERKEYISYDEVRAELTDFFEKNPNPDHITFSGSGEPTLNSRFADVLNFIKEIRPEVPIAVLTNGSLLWNDKVKQELLAADLILPSLDAVVANDFNKVNVPANGLNVNEYAQGVIDFCKMFDGTIWLEVLIIPEYNDSPENIRALKKVIAEINPTKVQLNTLDRPGTLTGIRAATKSELNYIIDEWQLPNVEIISSIPKRKDIKSYNQDTEGAILNTISRRPCTIKDLSEILNLSINSVNKYLRILEDEQKIYAVKQNRGFFYKLKR